MLAIAPGCSTLLEPGDATDNSSTDFALTAPSPRNNATAPTEAACGGGGGGGKPPLVPDLVQLNMMRRFFS